MPITLENERQTIPGVTFDTVGQVVKGLIVDQAVVPWYEYHNDGSRGEQKVSQKTGKPQTQVMITLLTREGTTALINTGQGKQVPAPGTLVRLYIRGHNRWDPDRPQSFGEVKEAFTKANGPLRVGDLIGDTYAKEEQRSAGANKKIHEYALRRPKPEEQHLITQAETAYQQMHAGTPLEAADPFPAQRSPAPAAAAMSVDDL